MHNKQTKQAMRRVQDPLMSMEVFAVPPVLGVCPSLPTGKTGCSVVGGGSFGKGCLLLQGDLLLLVAKKPVFFSWLSACAVLYVCLALRLAALSLLRL